MPFNLSLPTDNRRQMVLPEPREIEHRLYNVQTYSIVYETEHQLQNKGEARSRRMKKGTDKKRAIGSEQEVKRGLNVRENVQNKRQI